MRKFFPLLLLFFLSLSALPKFAQSRIQIEGEDSRANLQGNVQKESEEGEILAKTRTRNAIQQHEMSINRRDSVPDCTEMEESTIRLRAVAPAPGTEDKEAIPSPSASQQPRSKRKKRFWALVCGSYPLCCDVDGEDVCAFACPACPRKCESRSYAFQATVSVVKVQLH